MDNTDSKSKFLILGNNYWRRIMNWFFLLVFGQFLAKWPGLWNICQNVFLVSFSSWQISISFFLLNGFYEDLSSKLLRDFLKCFFFLLYEQSHDFSSLHLIFKWSFIHVVASRLLAFSTSLKNLRWLQSLYNAFTTYSKIWAVVVCCIVCVV